MARARYSEGRNRRPVAHRARGSVELVALCAPQMTHPCRGGRPTRVRALSRSYNDRDFRDTLLVVLC
jgi:hypothetical protein